MGRGRSTWTGAGLATSQFRNTGALEIPSASRAPSHQEGLGPAYLDGFRKALELGADLVFEMDCDFYHDPADVPRLAAAVEDADLVIGSRYVRGGGTRNWGLLRRLISRGGSLYAQLLLSVPVRDLTGRSRPASASSRCRSSSPTAKSAARR